MSKKILIAGGSGLVGSAFSQFASNQGHEVHILTRSKKNGGGKIHYHTWDPYHGKIDSDIPNIDVIINLTGAGIADKRWSAKRKKQILESRTLTTKFLISQFSDVDCYIGASAIGYYGKRDEQDIREDTGGDPDDFMSDVCYQWEEAHAQAQTIAKRVVIFRIGIVLSNDGGAFPKLVQPLSFGIAPSLGDGSMVYSWIHIDDVVSMMDYAMDTDLVGTYNMVAPHPATQKEIMNEASTHKALSLPIPTPTFILKTVFGEMSDAVLMSTHVSSQKIQDHGYQFTYGTLAPAIANLM